MRLNLNRPPDAAPGDSIAIHVANTPLRRADGMPHGHASRARGRGLTADSELRGPRAARLPAAADDDEYSEDNDDDTLEDSTHGSKPTILIVGCIGMLVATLCLAAGAAVLFLDDQRGTSTALSSQNQLPHAASHTTARRESSPPWAPTNAEPRAEIMPQAPSPSPSSPLPTSPTLARLVPIPLPTPPTQPPPTLTLHEPPLLPPLPPSPPPPLPLPPPPNPRFPPTGVTSEIVAQLNHQWTYGAPSGHLGSAGVLVHIFDNTEDDVSAKQSLGLPMEAATPWLPCSAGAWCGQFHGRLSASLINRRQRELFHSQTEAGVILSSANSIYCSYPVDGGTMNKFCPEGAPLDCAPGCANAETGLPNWCEHDEAWNLRQSAQVWDCAFRPEDLEAMLRHHLDSRASQYNEVVVDTRAYTDNLPASVLAFFFLASGRGGESEQKARAAHTRFRRRYPQTQAALVSLDLHQDNGAFRLVQ